jgi:hypothetical protein
MRWNRHRAGERPRTPVSLGVSDAEREVLCDQLLFRLSGIDAVWLAARSKEIDNAISLHRGYHDDLRVLRDLGWGDRSWSFLIRKRRQAVGFSTPADALHRVFGRLRDVAAVRGVDEARERIDYKSHRDQNLLLADACDRVLTELPGGADGYR